MVQPSPSFCDIMNTEKHHLLTFYVFHKSRNNALFVGLPGRRFNAVLWNKGFTPVLMTINKPDNWYFLHKTKSFCLIKFLTTSFILCTTVMTACRRLTDWSSDSVKSTSLRPTTWFFPATKQYSSPVKEHMLQLIYIYISFTHTSIHTHTQTCMLLDDASQIPARNGKNL